MKKMQVKIPISCQQIAKLPMADDDGRCGVAVAVVLRAGRQNNQDFSAKITKISAKITKICVRYERRFARFLLRLPP